MQNWFDNYKTSGNYMASLMAAVAMFLSGEDIADAAEQNHVKVEDIQRAARSKYKSTEITLEMIGAIRMIEGDDPHHIGPDNDTGVMQMLRSTWERVNREHFGGKYPYEIYKPGPQNPLNEDELIRLQVAFGYKNLQDIKAWLNTHRDKWNANEAYLIFATWNGGQGNVLKANFDPDVLKIRRPSVHSYATRCCNLIGEKPR